jgi:cysteine-rich repeat protein
MNGACGKNACGDSVVFEKEQCDDGNALDGDGCGATCRWEALAGCGNGSVDEGEECDDHNTVDDDACTLRCTVARCGDGVKASSEQCDDGNSSDVDGCTATCIASTEVQLAAAGLRVHSGDAALDKSRDLKSSVSTGSSSSGTGSNGSSTLTSTASSHPALPGFGARAGTGAAGKNGGSSASARSGGGSGSSASVGVNTSPLRTADDDPEAACEACRNANCRTYLGTDLVAGCYEAVNTDFGATAGDASFLLACQEVMNCAKTNKCGFDSNQASTCYCGSTNIDECAANGPGEDAPCVHEWQMATQSTQNMQILERMTDQRYPAAWAFHLLECERKVCPACIPKT